MQNPSLELGALEARLMRFHTRFGVWGLIALVTAVSIATSLLLTLAIALVDQTPEERESGVIFYYLLVAAIVPLIVAPLATAVLARLLIRLEEAHERLLLISTLDFLTGAANRRGFFEAADAARKSMKQDRQYLLGMIDLDRFKLLNDSYGHLAGDRVLKAVASKLALILEGHGRLGRIGGDEFAFFAVGSEADLEQLGRCVAQECDGLLLEVVPEAGELGVSASVGLAYLQKEESIDQALLRADQALYANKKKPFRSARRQSETEN
jgi:diguanylate cyclase (GGDEF)-like protein